MKKMKRMMVWMLAVGLLLTSLTGCGNRFEPVEDLFDNVGDALTGITDESQDDEEEKPDQEPEEEKPAPETPAPEDPTTEDPTTEDPAPVEPTPEKPGSEDPEVSETDPAEPVIPMAELEYNLTEEDIAIFETQLLLCEAMLQDGAAYADMEEAADTLDEMAYNIQSQATIAEVLYYYDMEEEEAVDNYLFSSEVSTEITTEYIGFLVDLYKSGEYEEYFADLLEIELQYLECYTDETTELEIRNAEILTEFYDLQNGDFEGQMGALYTEFVQNGNEIAIEHGFANYYDYASTFTYKRDYGKQEREQFRAYVKEYIIPLYNSAYEWYEDSYYELSRKGRKIIDALIVNEYDSLEKDYVNDYFESLPEDSKNGMQHMFKNETYFMTDNRNALEGAFTVDIDTPYCYFGPGYQDAFTVIHELGHYYADLNTDTSWLSFDLCETHSQGNEMLFLRHLATELDPKVFDALEAYKLYAFLDTIVQATLMDNFEEKVYNLSFEESFTTEDFDEVMHEVIRDYGIADGDEYTYACLEWLWRNVGISSPVYYISYATSAMASLSLYSQSVADQEAALESYRILQKECEQEAGFMGMLEKAGIASVFEEEAYIRLQETMNR